MKFKNPIFVDMADATRISLILRGKWKRYKSLKLYKMLSPQGKRFVDENYRSSLS